VDNLQFDVASLYLNWTNSHILAATRLHIVEQVYGLCLTPVCNCILLLYRFLTSHGNVVFVSDLDVKLIIFMTVPLVSVLSLLHSCLVSLFCYGYRFSD
jgi:hypothetical protein